MLLRVGASSLVGGFEADVRKVETLLSGMCMCIQFCVCLCVYEYVCMCTRVDAVESGCIEPCGWF